MFTIRSVQNCSTLNFSTIAKCMVSSFMSEFPLLVVHPSFYSFLQWQQHQVDHYCRKYNITGVKYQLPSDSASRARLLYNLIFVDENEVVFAGIPKVRQSYVT